MDKGFMSKSGKSLLVLISFMFMGFLVFYPALRIGFLGDFAGDLWGSQDSWFNFGAYQWNFYVPAMAVYSSLYKIFHLSSLPYQVFHLTLIFINAWLVYLLAQELKLESWQCWVAGFLALLNSPAFEAYFWLSTIPKTLAMGCGLVALIFLSRLRQTRASIWGWGYLVMVAMGISLESTGLILPLLGLCLDTYYQPWKRFGEPKVAPFPGLRLHFWSFGSAGIFLLIRHFLGIRPYVINLPLSKKYLTLTRTIFSTFFHAVSNPFSFAVNHITPVSIMLFLVLLIVLMWAWYVKQGSDRRRFVALMLLWLSACLPHTIGANFQSRYLYFPGIFAALVVADFLESLRTRLYVRKSAWLFISLVIVGYLATDLHAFHQSLGYYLEATRIYDAGIQKIKSSLDEMPVGTRLVLVDFPDYICRPRSIHQVKQGRYDIIVYRNALPAHLRLLDQNFNLTVTFLKLSHPNINNNSDLLGTPVSPEQLAKLLAAPQTTTLRYLPGNPEKFVIIREPYSFDAAIGMKGVDFVPAGH